MWADLRVYAWDLISNWAGLFWAGSLVLDVAGFVLRKSQILAISDCLDQWIVEENRIRILRIFFIAGLLIAGFIAWDEQYQIAISKSPEALTQTIGVLSTNLAVFQQREWPVIKASKERELVKTLKALQSHAVLVWCTNDGCNRLADQLRKDFQESKWPKPKDAEFDFYGFGMAIFTTPPLVSEMKVLGAVLHDATGVLVDVKTGEPTKGADVVVGIGRRPES
jgi:hypothetical protein